jgi:hypothetical protein
MKKFKLLSLVSITSMALAHAGWAAGHGGGGGGHGGGFRGGGFQGGAFRGGGFGGRFGSMGGGHMFGRGGPGVWRGRNWTGRNWSSNWRHHHRFSNDVIFFDDFGFPGWWGWGYSYGYYGYDYYPYDYYGYPGTDIAMAADQGICTGRGIGNKRATTL